MSIDLHKEHYDSDGNQKPLTVYPEKDTPEIYPGREIYPNTDIVNGTAAEKLPDNEAVRRIEKKKTNIRCFAAVILSAAVLSVIISLIFASVQVNTDTYENSEMFFVQNDVNSIRIDTANTNVVLRYNYSSSGNIKVNSLISKKADFTASNDGGTLRISCEGADSEEPDTNGTVTVTFSGRFYGRVDISSEGTGSVSSEAGGELYIRTEGGGIKAHGLKCGTAELTAQGGDISVNNSRIDTLTAEADGGDINIMDSEIAQGLNVRAYNGDFVAENMVSSGETDISASSRNYMDGTVSCENITLGENASISGSQSLMLVNAEFHNISLGSSGYIDIYPTLPKELYWIKKSGGGDLYIEGENFRDYTVNYNPVGEYIMNISSNNLVKISWLNDDDEQTQQ